MTLQSGQLAHLFAGIEHFKRDEFHEAIAHFEAAIQIGPDNMIARWNRATALLSLGDYERGFVEHEDNWRRMGHRGFGPVEAELERLTATLPVWSGQTHCRLLVYHELGFGDSIMTMRYLPELNRRRCDVTLVIDPSLTRLAMEFGVTTVTHVPADLAQYDYRLPFFAVLVALKETIGTIPSAPYIHRKWRRNDDKIGIAWSGRTQRMFSCRAFRALLNPDPTYALHSLHPADEEIVRQGVEPLPSNCDFSDVADRIAHMDHIVTVDTAAAHLAGAMGHPSVHLVLPRVMDWRWWHSEVWYPTIKTYRQPEPDDWETPFARLRAALG